ncbi:hypothetical protein ACJ72_02709 [Emergomyces africanus]|uniref:Uncharacterized protein n=1 Tax=Emergomyces africanus TaxID=1955775 RepID=A0A1B7P1N1_9EURO|nr:hypothetical protein ACJ72_02709 [Emergomyces africanus]
MTTILWGWDSWMRETTIEARWLDLDKYINLTVEDLPRSPTYLGEYNPLDIEVPLGGEVAQQQLAGAKDATGFLFTV